MAVVKGGGTPVNDGERRTIAYLRDNLPRHYAIVHNVDLSERPGTRPHDYDVIVIGEHGIYPIEVKDWHGTIYGNADGKWILNDGERRDNPVQSICHKARVLNSYLQRQGSSYLIAEVSGLVVIADTRAVLKLSANVADRVRRLSESLPFLTSRPPVSERLPGRAEARKALTARDIESLANAMLGWLRRSPLRDRFGEYDVIERIRHTENSVDYLARHVRLEKRGIVRLRVYEFDRFLETPQREAQQRLILREMEALTALQPHPNIIRAYDPFEWDGDKICAPTEWIQNGLTLRDRLEESGPLSPASLDPIVTQVCAGLAFAHANGVIHRGLSPDSILLSPGGTVKLIDFDYARVPGLVTLSSIAVSLGDTPYAAPEQVTDSMHADYRADIYGLGVTLYHALTGQVPNAREAIAPSTLNRRVPGGLDAAVMKMMARDASERYQSVGAACDAFTNALGG